MKENEVYVLFGNEETIKNYFISVHHLITKTPNLDYIVCSYGLSNLQNSKNFLWHLDKYHEFLFISQEDFRIIYHALCTKARNFMKKGPY